MGNLVLKHVQMLHDQMHDLTQNPCFIGPNPAPRCQCCTHPPATMHLQGHSDSPTPTGGKLGG